MKDDTKKDASAAAPAPALTEARVQQLIDAAFIRFNIEHGHLGAEDGAAALDALHELKS